MLALAPLVGTNPALLVADEPTLGLAPRVADGILAVFDDLRSSGTTILLVEEKARAVLEIADHVALLDLGRIVWVGPASEMDQGALVSAYLGQGIASEISEPLVVVPEGDRDGG
jgi:ABC-type branched-subunit amino acid transport system ATPase component